MKKNIISALIFCYLLSMGIDTMGQTPLSLYYLENVPQSVNINPAMIPRANAFFGVPGINSVYTGFNTDMLGPDLYQATKDGNVTITQEGYDYTKFYDRIGDYANLNMYQTLAPIVMGFSGKKGYFTFGWTEKLDQNLKIPKDVFSILEKGGLPDNTSVDFSNFGLNAKYYREISFGYSYKFMSNLRVGAHAKVLQGLAAIKSKMETFNIAAEGLNAGDLENIRYDMDIKGKVYLSAPVSINYDDNGFPSGIVKPDVDLKYAIDKGLLNFSNPGFAFDFGAVYDYSDAWTFSASVNDLGFIKWNGDLSTFSVDGSFSFDGSNISDLDPDSIGSSVGDLITSFKEAINLSSGHESFVTGLGPQIYLGALYNVNHYFSAGGLSRTVFAKNNFRQEFNVSGNLNLYHVLTTTINYTLAINGANSFGFGFALRGGPLQFYMTADYLPYSFTDVVVQKTSIDENGNTVIDSEKTIPAPTKLKNFNIMFGLNFVFGANGYRDEPMIDAYNEF